MLSLKKILTQRTNFSKMQEITTNEWADMDYALDIYTRTGRIDMLYSLPAFAFVLQQIEKDRKWFIETPNFIHNDITFQKIAAMVNPKLSNMLFPGNRSEVLRRLEMERNDDGTYSIRYCYDRGDGIELIKQEKKVGVKCCFEVPEGENTPFPIIEDYAVLQEKRLASVYTADSIVIQIDEPSKEIKDNLDILNLSYRTQMVLRRSGIRTVGQLRNKNPEELLQIRNFGKTSLEEVIKALGYNE